MNDSNRETVARPRDIRVFSLINGFHGGVAKVAAMLSKLNERPSIDMHTVVLNNPESLCNRGDLDAYDLEEIAVHGRRDFSWLKPCAEIINSYKPDLLLVHGGCVPAAYAWLLQRKVKYPLPFVISNHGYYLPAPSERQSLRRYYHSFQAWLTPWFYQHRAFAVVTVAEHCKRYYVSRGVDADKITVVHNGIASEIPQCDSIPRSSLNLGEDDIVIGTVSRIEPEKGLDYLADAFASLVDLNPRIHLVVVGGGQGTEQLRQQCRQLGVDSRVHLFEYQDHTQSWMDLFDIYVLPSLREGHSIALLEAMRAGKPIVATDVPGNLESVDDQKEALLVPPKDPKAIAVAIDRLLKDHELSKTLSEAAQKRFLQHFTMDHMLDNMETWLIDCVRQARSR